MAQCSQFFSKRKLELTKPCCTDQNEFFLIRTAGQFFFVRFRTWEIQFNFFQDLSGIRMDGILLAIFERVNNTMRKYILATQESKCCWAVLNLRYGTELIKTTPLLIHQPHFLGLYRRVLVLGPYSQAWPTYRAHLSSSLPSIMRNPTLQFLFRSVWSETILVLILAEFFQRNRRVHRARLFETYLRLYWPADTQLHNTHRFRYPNTTRRSNGPTKSSTYRNRTF